MNSNNFKVRKSSIYGDVYHSYIQLLKANYSENLSDKELIDVAKLMVPNNRYIRILDHTSDLFTFETFYYGESSRPDPYHLFWVFRKQQDNSWVLNRYTIMTP